MAIDPCTEYGLALALEDFVPVLFAGIGSVVLALAAGRSLPAVRVPALLAGALVTLGGFCKALWKTLVAAEPCRDFPILENLLFPCLAFGFAGIAWALLSVRRGSTVAWPPFLVLPALAAAGALLVGDTWPLLIVSAIAGVTVGVLALLISRSHGDKLGVALFVVYILGILVLPPLGSRPHQSEEIQWAEQITNSIVQLCYLLGALRIRSRVSASAPVREGVLA